MLIEINEIDNISQEHQETILYSIMDNRMINLGWIKYMLGSVLRISGRTRYYNAFQHPYFYNTRNRIHDQDGWPLVDLSIEQQEERTNAVKEILQKSSLSNWIVELLMEVKLSVVLQIIEPYIDSKQINIRVQLTDQQLN